MSYNISLVDASDKNLSMPLSDNVELCFEVFEGLDRHELEVVLARQMADAEFTEELVELDGSSWVNVKTNHFSPYGLIDKLSDAEKAALGKGNVPTGDQAAQVAVSGLGIMLRLITNKRKFEK